ncbi:quinoprotein relay system zinc metallohydrolase 2 [Paracoccus sp. (in: a-proteobacteria)]|uniref:quinoprotein relay system zinc metallohydrolase 2 n=1 Tax=Paracoccus sp. TaxID=267 RepID=UPI00396C5324
MIHLILAACLASSPQECGTILLPQGDAATQQECMAQARRIAAEWLALHADLTGGAVECRANADLPAAGLQQVAPGVHVHLGQMVQMEESADGRIANLGVIIGDNSVAVIDAGVSRAEGQALLVAIRRLTDKPITDLVLTHVHPDHALGASVMVEAGARVWGHEDLPRALETRGPTYLDNLTRLYPASEWIGTRIVAAGHTVREDVGIDLGGRRLRLTVWPAAHTDSDLTVLDEATGTFFAGDLVFRTLTPVLDGSLPGWLDWMDKAPSIEARLIVPGHGNVARIWDEALQPQRDFLSALADSTRARISEGVPMSQAVPMIVDDLQPMENRWSSFDATVGRNATAAYKELEWE